MTSYTPYLNLYQPNRLDNLEVDTTLADNFRVIDQMVGPLLKNAVSVMSFGANGDGKTDDTAAINNAIQSLPSSGGVIVLPYGHTFMIQGWAVGHQNDYPTGGIKLKSNVTLLMLGATVQIIPNNKSGYAGINITDCDNVRVIGGIVIGERDKHTKSPEHDLISYGGINGDQWGTGISIIGSYNVSLENLSAVNCYGDGLCVGAGARGISYNVSLKNCLFENNRRNNVSLAGLYVGNIDSCIFRRANGFSPECGMDMEPNPGCVVSHVRVTNNTFIDNYQHGLLLASILTDVRSAMHCVIEGNVFAYNKLSGFYANRADNNIINSNQSFENGDNGYSFLESTFNTISDNHATRNGFSGYMFGNCDDNQIISNYAKGNGQKTTADNDIYDQYSIFSSHRNNILNNIARHMNEKIKPRYGMLITPDCEDNIASGNDMAWSGSSGGFNNASPSTIKGAGNRGSNFTTGSEVVKWGDDDFL